MNLFSPPRKVTRAPPQPAASLRVQSSAQGQARALGWGRARLAGNLIGFWNFAATAITSSAQGGKGGGGTFTSGYSYSCAVAIGLCEGTIAAILQAWSNKTPEDFSAIGFSAFAGTTTQAPWAWLGLDRPGYAQNFRGLAYAANPTLLLGTDPALPNLTFEIQFGVGNAVVEVATVPATPPYTIAARYYDVTANAASEEITIPFGATSEYTAQNPDGLPFTQTGIVGTTAVQTLGGASSGVFYTDTDPPVFLTSVGTVPTSAGQFHVLDTTLYFDPAEAGTAVTIVDLCVSPGVFYGEVVTANAVSGSASFGALSAIAAIGVGSPVSGAGAAAGSAVVAVSGGAATVAASLGSATVAVSGGSYAAPAGTPIADSAAVFPAGTTVVGGTYEATLGAPAAGGASETITYQLTIAGSFGAEPTISLATTTGILAGAMVSDPGGLGALIGAVPVVSVAAGSVEVSLANEYGGNSWTPGAADTFTFTMTAPAVLTNGSAVLTGLPVLLPAGALVTDPLGYVDATVASSAGATIVLSQAATGNASGDVVSFAPELVLSLPATATVTGATLTIAGPALHQVLGTPGAAGEFALTPAGTYSFSAGDAGKTVIIVDVPDANPADVVADFLTNPFYGVPLFAPARLGDLSLYRNYCQAAGLFVSPVLTSQAQATQLLQDLMTATNSEIVWSGGKLTAVPYGDAALAGNGAAYTPPLQPLYSLDDDDFLPNQASNSSSVSATGSPDPVTVTRLDPADQVNVVQLEYLDRAQDYNPVIAEAQDDAGINLYGLKPSGSKQLHLLCERKTALQSAQLQLGRALVRNLYSFTLGREFILVDPMDIVAITDSGLGLADQWVRIREITENKDRSLSIVAEEYLAGTGAAPKYGHQAGSGYRPNFNQAPGNALAPVFMDVPAQLAQTLGCEGWIATAGTPPWGGCDVWQSSDDVNFHYAGTLQGGSCMGTLTASFGSGSDPDTANTCAVDLTESGGTVLPGTQADADNANTVCFVCNADGSNGEYFSYEQAVLTVQYKYNLGKNGASAGYLRRGLFGSPIASHPAGSPFVRLRPNSVFKLPFAKGQIGNTVYVKLLSFNLWGGGMQTLDQVASHAHVIGGAAPALSSVGALALASDLDPGAATNAVAATAGSVNVTSVYPAQTTLASAVLDGLGGAPALIAATVTFYPASAGSPTKIIFGLQVGGADIWYSDWMTLPAANSLTVSFSTKYTTGLGNQTYSLQAYIDAAGTVPTNNATLSVVELRR